MQGVPLRIFPALLVGDDLDEEQNWRLTDTLFGQLESLLQGSLVLVALQLVGWFRTNLPLFGWLAAATALLTAGRLALTGAYWRRRAWFPPRRWAAIFTGAGIATALAWGATTIVVQTRVTDFVLLMGVLMVQTGWTAGVAVRNAASPAAAALQSAAVVVPSTLGILANPDTALHWLGLFYPVQLSANGGIAQHLGAQMLSLLTSERALAQANARLTASCANLSASNVQLRHLSETDGLTGIGNRRALEAALAAEWGRAAQSGAPLSLLMLDVDLFKSFNDHYGHPAGDDCLRLVAMLLERGLRHPPDVAARFGGEEFVALLPGIDAEGARAAAERLRGLVMEAAHPHAASPFGVVTISIGAATGRPGSGGEAPQLIAAADQALYRAKEAGRNRVALADGPPAL